MTSSEHLDLAEPEGACNSELISYYPVSISFLPLATKGVLMNEYTVVRGMA